MTGWVIDAVITRLITPEERDEIRQAAEDAREGLIKDRVPITSINERRISIGVDRRNGARRILGFCMLGDGIRYACAHDRSYQMMGPNGPEGLKRVDFEPSLHVEGTLPPQSIVDALVGRHACDVFDHHALRVEGLVVTASYVNTRDGVPYGFSVGLPQVNVAL